MVSFSYSTSFIVLLAATLRTSGPLSGCCELSLSSGLVGTSLDDSRVLSRPVGAFGSVDIVLETLTGSIGAIGAYTYDIGSFTFGMRPTSSTAAKNRGLRFQGAANAFYQGELAHTSRDLEQMKVQDS
jgi:hypothetical protein